MNIPQNIVDSLTKKGIKINEPVIHLGNAKVKISFAQMEHSDDLASSTPHFVAEVYDKPERKPRKPRAQQPAAKAAKK